MTTGRTYVIREMRESEADDIVREMHRVRGAGHEIADVRHEGGVWRIFAHDRRRVRELETVGMISFRRRSAD